MRLKRFLLLFFFFYKENSHLALFMGCSVSRTRSLSEDMVKSVRITSISPLSSIPTIPVHVPSLFVFFPHFSDLQEKDKIQHSHYESKKLKCFVIWPEFSKCMSFSGLNEWYWYYSTCDGWMLHQFNSVFYC